MRYAPFTKSRPLTREEVWALDLDEQANEWRFTPKATSAIRSFRLKAKMKSFLGMLSGAAVICFFAGAIFPMAVSIPITSIFVAAIPGMWLEAGKEAAWQLHVARKSYAPWNS